MKTTKKARKRRNRHRQRDRRSTRQQTTRKADNTIHTKATKRNTKQQNDNRIPSQTKKFRDCSRRHASWKPETELKPADRRPETCQPELETELIPATRNRKTKCIQEDGRPIACAQQSFLPREVKAPLPLHMRGGTSFEETKLSLQQPPHHKCIRKGTWMR